MRTYIHTYINGRNIATCPTWHEYAHVRTCFGSNAFLRVYQLYVRSRVHRHIFLVWVFIYMSFLTTAVIIIVITILMIITMTTTTTNNNNNNGSNHNNNNTNSNSNNNENHFLSYYYCQLRQVSPARPWCTGKY